MTTQHTPTPWLVFQAQAGNAVSLMVDGYTVAINLSRRDAEFIKNACNAHDELVKENDRLRQHIERRAAGVDPLTQQLRAERDELVAALRLIAETDAVDAALDPQRAVVLARAVLERVRP